MTIPIQPDARTPRKGPPAHAPNAALLIDFDNVTMGIRSDLQAELRRLLESDIIRGKVAVQRAYADWRRYPQYIVPLSESSIDLIFAPAVGPNKKNATDIRLAIDALELVFTRPEIGTFILLSGDSDFSALVLKLKEYGKYVVGVGFRESSSDMLIQNCDEYYSYTDFSGFTKEGDVQVARRDPWELVVEAVVRMEDADDAMRSDRLKQVMQEIDPSFTEKEVGFSRFSRFVHEAAARGLLRIEKLANGQLEIGLGPDANTALFDRKEPRREEAPRSRDTSAREPEAERGLELAEAFDLLRRAMHDAVGDVAVAVAADDIRERMIELHGSSDPILDSRRFSKLLRQAHDASVVNVHKSDDGRYELTLVAAESAEEEAGSEKPKPRTARRGHRKKEPVAQSTETDGEGASGGDAEESPEAESPAAAKQKAPSKRRRTARKPKAETTPAPDETGASSRSEPETASGRQTPSTDSTASRASHEEEPGQEPATDVPSSTVNAASGGKAPSVVQSKRNPRFRSGSRSRGRQAESQDASGAAGVKPRMLSDEEVRALQMELEREMSGSESPAKGTTAAEGREGTPRPPDRDRGQRDAASRRPRDRSQGSGRPRGQEQSPRENARADATDRSSRRQKPQRRKQPQADREPRSRHPDSETQRSRATDGQASATESPNRTPEGRSEEKEGLLSRLRKILNVPEE